MNKLGGGSWPSNVKRARRLKIPLSGVWGSTKSENSGEGCFLCLQIPKNDVLQPPADLKVNGVS